MKLTPNQIEILKAVRQEIERTDPDRKEVYICLGVNYFAPAKETLSARQLRKTLEESIAPCMSMKSYLCRNVPGFSKTEPGLMNRITWSARLAWLDRIIEKGEIEHDPLPNRKHGQF